MTNKIKLELEQMASAGLLPNKSHASANVSLLACWQKLSTATDTETMCKMNTGLVVKRCFAPDYSSYANFHPQPPGNKEYIQKIQEKNETHMYTYIHEVTKCTVEKHNAQARANTQKEIYN